MAQVVIIPKLGLTMTTGQVAGWLKQEGEAVKAGEPLFELMTDKITTEVESPADGYLLKILLPAGTEAGVLAPACVVGAQGENYEIPAVSPDQPEARQEEDRSLQGGAASDAAGKEGIRISPLARRLAEENGIDLAVLRGTGPDGRIVKEDVLAAVAMRSGNSPQTAADKRMPLAGIRRIIAERLSRSKREIPHTYFKIAVEAGKLKACRDGMSSGRKPSYNDLLIKAAAQALSELPAMNVSVDGQEIVQHGEIHIGLAMSIGDGLVVPVVKNAGRKTLAEITAETALLIEKARSGRLAQDDVSGGTFTVSNLGMYGLDEFTAVINPPESAILAAGAVLERPWVKEGRLVVAPVMQLTLSVDHRVIDGALAAQFLARMKQILEEPDGLW